MHTEIYWKHDKFVDLPEVRIQFNDYFYWYGSKVLELWDFGALWLILNFKLPDEWDFNCDS